MKKRIYEVLKLVYGESQSQGYFTAKAVKAMFDPPYSLSSGSIKAALKAKRAYRLHTKSGSVYIIVPYKARKTYRFDYDCPLGDEHEYGAKIIEHVKVTRKRGLEF